MKKRILIVECNAKIGGIQKALISLLKQISDVYDVTLLLLHRQGALLQDIHDNVRLLTTGSDFKYMGMAQADCLSLRDKLLRGLYVLISRFVGRGFAVRLAAWTLCRDKQEEYDTAIAFSHMGNDRTFYAGAPEYVLHAVNAKEKICCIHCDYLNSGNRSSYSDGLYQRFDAITCVSKSTRERFIQAKPELSERTFVAYNPIDSTSVIQQAGCNTVAYDEACVNLVSVARLTAEKGIARFVRILSSISSSKVRYWIVGDGQERAEIEHLIVEHHMEHMVTLCGEDSNPYRYMANADLLVVPSYHEAAPVVFQEAKVLGIPVFTTRTTSADEMVGDDFGFVVDNEDDALEKGLRILLSQPERIYKKREAVRCLANKLGGTQIPELIALINKLAERQE